MMNGKKKMMNDKETINAKIRNRLSPITNLIALLKAGLPYENYIADAENAVKKLCELGYDVYSDKHNE